MRDLVRALCTLENELLDNYGITLNEAMVLCSMADETVNAGTVAERTGLAPSHCSKVINSAEKKGLLTRSLNNEDKRQMYFSLTDKARQGKSLSCPYTRKRPGHTILPQAVFRHI